MKFSFLPIALLLVLMAGVGWSGASGHGFVGQTVDLRARDPLARAAAARELGALRQRDAVRPLIEALSDSEANVREEAAFSLGQLTDRSASESLMRALKDTSPQVRATAALALGYLADSRAEDSLFDALEDRDVEVRASAATALGLMQDEGAVEELTALLNDPAFDVRFDAAWALGHIGDPEAVEHLRFAQVTLESLKVDETLKEAFREQVQNSIDSINSIAGVPGIADQTRPRRVASSRRAEQPDDEVFQPAAIIHWVRPALNERALRGRVAGFVELRLLVGANGRPVRAYVTRRLGHGLDRRAIMAALQYKFDPAMHKGMPQVDWVELKLYF